LEYDLEVVSEGNSWRGGTERLRWAQLILERGVGSPKDKNTHRQTQTNSNTCIYFAISHSSAVP